MVAKIPIEEGYHNGFVAIWWYTDDGNFWDFSKSLDDADEDFGYLQYSNSQNHCTLWRTAVRNNVSDVDKQNEIIAKGYKSIERGRVIYNIRTQSYEIICSDSLLKDPDFRNKCIEYFNLKGNRYNFQSLSHYGKQELTGNPALDSMYYEV